MQAKGRTRKQIKRNLLSVLLSRRSFLQGAVPFGVGMSPIGRLLGAAESPFKDLPDYYAPYLSGVAERVNANAKTCADGFWFMSDIHLPFNSGRSGKIIAALAGMVPIDKTFCGGDLVWAFTWKDINCRESVDECIHGYCENWVKPITDAGLALYTAKGNHDFTINMSKKWRSARTGIGWTYSDEEARRILMETMNSRDVVTNVSDPTACYFYVDNAAAKIRYIVADTTDRVRQAGDAPWAVSYGMHESQLKWLAETALGGMDAGWNAVLVHHVPMTTLVGAEESHIKKHYADFCGLCEAYQNRGVVELFGRKYDFSGACGRIMLSITGHYHAERQTFQKGILHVTEPCDTRGDDYMYGGGKWCGELPKREDCSIYEQCFDAVQLDTVRGIVHFTRVGGGQNRAIHTQPLKVKAGGSLALKAPTLSGQVTWGCYDADRIKWLPNPKSEYCKLVDFLADYATISHDGTLRGVRPGEVVAVAMDANLNKEIWPVTVA